MKIGIDISPLSSGHKVRGTGFYLHHLKDALIKYYPDNEYLFYEGNSGDRNVDLIHVPYFDPFFLTLPLRPNKKFVVTVHDLTPLVFAEHFPAGLKGKAKWLVQKNTLKKASAIITDSESSKKDIIKILGFPDSKVRVAYLAAGEEFKQNKKVDEVIKKYKLPDKFVLYVGDATWNKNLPRIVMAIKQVGVPLVMVGKALADSSFDRSNPWNKDLVEVETQASDDKLFFKLGFLPTDDLVKIYNAATVLVMPSIYEGFGLPILEAMACGCPVITSKEGSLPEVAGSAAYYVDPYNQASIAEGITKVYSDNALREKMTEEGFAQVAKFSWKKTAEETVETYKKVLENES